MVTYTVSTMGIDYNYFQDFSMLLIYLSVFIGLISHIKLFWQFRRYIAFILVLTIGFGSGVTILSNFNPVLLAILLIFQAYRIFSYLRVVKNKINPESLRLKSFKTEIYLGSSLSILLVIYSIFGKSIMISDFFIIISSLQFIVSVIYILHLYRFANYSTLSKGSSKVTDNLPSITVAIPARNETYDLTDCLLDVINSNYPKMEILVYDDCSQDATSDIIKNFAHDGVRFIEGKVPPDSWMPKNFAYNQLLEEADGKYVLFCGTDVRFEKNSINKLVHELIQNKLSMISVLPIRNNLNGVHQIVQPMRYWRELIIPKIFKPSPPTLSTVWIADKRMLLKFGGFKAFKKSIRPEKHFSKRFAEQNIYKFIRSSSGLLISSKKGYKAQINTAVRTRYPEYQSRTEKVLFGSLWQFIVYLMPLPLALIELASGYFYYGALSLSASIILLIICYKLDYFTNYEGSWKKVILFPVSVISEIIISNYSMWAYEFSEVIWKGRNICLPVLQRIPNLPKI